MKRNKVIIFVISLFVIISFTCITCTPSNNDQQSNDNGSNPINEPKPDKTIETPISKELLLQMASGPSGGKFIDFSLGMEKWLNDHVKNIKISIQKSEGSTENIRRVNSGLAHFGIAYSGDSYLAKLGELGDNKHYTNVRAICFLYEAPAQLVVLKNSNIRSVKDLVGRRVDIGPPGSGAAASAKRYFNSLGMDDKIKISHLGYDKAAQSILDKQIDAFWILSGHPTPAIVKLSNKQDIRLLDLWEEGTKHGLTQKHPYYKKLTISRKEIRNKYKGVDQNIDSFFDSTIFIVNKDVPDSVVYQALQTIYSKEGLASLAESTKNKSNQMSLDNGIKGIAIPLHKGAYKFWKDQNKKITDLNKLVE